MKAHSYSAITPEAQRGIELAAAEVGAKVTDVQGFFLAGEDWDASTPEELADLIAECWRDREQSGLADRLSERGRD